ncbi:putative tRNA threonylcarbamoyladenosine biosynthesis protein kae1 [Chytriomyces hyalinus]|nr:putative tRNA threonylcarbamoyladenosine biosynthesis protein kae1 [Chytriomyces hyalinus]
MHTNPKTRKSRTSTANTPLVNVSSPQQTASMSPPGMQATSSITASSPQKNASPVIPASGGQMNLATLMGGSNPVNSNMTSVEGGGQLTGPPPGVNPSLYAQLQQFYPQISTMPPQLVQQMVLQFQVRMAAMAAMNNNGQLNTVNAVPNSGNGEVGQSTATSNVNLNLMMNMFNNPNTAALGANAGTTTAPTNFQNSANGLGGNHAAMSAMMANSPNLAANMKMMQIFRQQQHLMRLQDANNGAGLPGGVATRGTSSGALPPNTNPAMAAYFGRNALTAAALQPTQLLNNARNMAAKAANTSSVVADRSNTPAPVNTGSPANNENDANSNGEPTAQQPQSNQGPQSVANMSAQEIRLHRNALFARVQGIAAAISRPGISEMDKLTLLLNRFTIQIQLTQLDHFLRLKSGIAIQPAEAEATKNAVQQLKLNIANLRARIGMQQSAGQPQTGFTAQAPHMGTESNAMIPNAPASASVPDLTASSSFPANSAMAQVSNSIAQYTQQSPAGLEPVANMRPAVLNHQNAQTMTLPVSPQQSRPLFGGVEAYLGGRATGPVSTLQGFLSKTILELPQKSMEEQLNALLDDSRKPGIDSDRANGAKRKLCELLADTDASETLDSRVEDVLYTLADAFIDHVTQVACKVAKHRHSKVAKIKDFQFPLEQSWNLRIPTSIVHPPNKGSNTPGLHASPLKISMDYNGSSMPITRSPQKCFATPTHISRNVQVKKALRDDQIYLARQGILETQRLLVVSGGAECADEVKEESDTSDVGPEREVVRSDEDEGEPEAAARSDEIERESDAVVTAVGDAVIEVDLANGV